MAVIAETYIDASADEAGYAAPAQSTVAWSAVFAGALTALAATVILVALGSGLGLAVVPSAPAPVAVTAAMAVWLVIVQWLASAFGGYLTGRMRSRWLGLHAHEVFFRDTANGFLAWALATAAGVVIIALAASSGAESATRLASAAAPLASRALTSSTSTAPATADGITSGYLVDTLFRTVTPNSDLPLQDVRPEALRLIAVDVRDGAMPAPDRTYLASLVSARTGLAEPEAEQRVDAVYAQAKAAEARALAAADKARKAATSIAILTALSMLVGAFIAAVAGALGGRHRDEWVASLASLR